MILGNIRDMLILSMEEYIVEISSIMIYSARQSKLLQRAGTRMIRGIILKSPLPLATVSNG